MHETGGRQRNMRMVCETQKKEDEIRDSTNIRGNGEEMR
jgi:hypothetical protein